MEFEFSAVLDEADCHVRVYRNAHHLNETVDQSPHKHYFMEFHCVFRGEETVYLPQENRSITLRPGQILLLPGGCYHGAKTQTGTVERMCFNFSAESVGNRESDLFSRFKKAKNVMIFENAEAYALMCQCRGLRLHEGESMLQQRLGLLLLCVVTQLLAEMSGAQSVPVRREDQALRQKWAIEQYIEQHFADPVGLEGLAGELNLSQRQTRKLVRRFMGEDYKTIVIRRRMELAEIYLRNREKSLDEIAWQVGYSSYSGFQLSFKKHYGVTPSERRKQLLEKL